MDHQGAIKKNVTIYIKQIKMPLYRKSLHILKGKLFRRNSF